MIWPEEIRFPGLLGLFGRVKENRDTRISLSRFFSSLRQANTERRLVATSLYAMAEAIFHVSSCGPARVVAASEQRSIIDLSEKLLHRFNGTSGPPAERQSSSDRS